MRLAKLVVLTVAATLLTASSASAAFHLMKVSEVYPGTLLNPDAAFVELQMVSGGQRFVNGHSVTVYNSAGTVTATVAMDADVGSGQNNRTILLGDSNVPERDFEANIGTLVSPSGGAVCFADAAPPDCVSWGSFAGMGLPGATGTPAVPAGIPDGQSLQRSMAQGCPTLMEAVDDTDDSAADFAAGTPTPRGNGEPVTEQTCGGPGPGNPPQTKIVSGPKKKTKKRKAKFRFRAKPAAAASFECKLDKRKFKPCSSPTTYKRLKRGKHKLAVRATNVNGTDATPATYRWKVKKKRKRR